MSHRRSFSSKNSFHLGALRFRARGVSGLPGDLASAAVTAHAFDVGNECYLGHLARRIDRHGGC